MKKIISLILLILTITSFTIIPVSAANSDSQPTLPRGESIESIIEREGLTTPEPETIPEEPVEPETEAATETTEPKTENIEEPPETTTVEAGAFLPQDIEVQGKGFITFFAVDTKHNAEVKIKHIESKEEFEFVLNEENNYSHQGHYPLGEYEVKSVKIEKITEKESKKNDKKEYEKVKEITIVETNSEKFNITEDTTQSISIKAELKKENIIIGMLKREWYLFLILIGLVIGYFYKKKNRVLPSKEN